jgi:hypothetical protein
MGQILKYVKNSIFLLIFNIYINFLSFGINSYASPPFPTFLSLFLDSFEDRTLQILLGSAIISMVLGITVAHEEYESNHF